MVQHALQRQTRIVTSLKNSAIVGAGTVHFVPSCSASPARLVLTQIWPKLRATYYTVVIAPILIPGVVLGISTLVFWGRLNTMLGLPDDGFLRNGIFLTVLGQTTFIASYCMLVFIARLQRFDQGQMEAALDLGATHAQAFRKILLPFLKPAFGSAAVIAFLASFENYNTTTFTFGTYPTLTIELAQKVRYGINPSISALAVIIVGLTVLGALLHEAYKRREALALTNGAPIGSVKSGLKLPAFLQNNPAAIVLVLVGLSFIGTLWFSQVHDPAACKIEVREIKRQEAEQRRQELLKRREEQRMQRQMQGPDILRLWRHPSQRRLRQPIQAKVRSATSSTPAISGVARPARVMRQATTRQRRKHPGRKARHLQRTRAWLLRQRVRSFESWRVGSGRQRSRCIGHRCTTEDSPGPGSPAPRKILAADRLAMYSIHQSWRRIDRLSSSDRQSPSNTNDRL